MAGSINLEDIFKRAAISLDAPESEAETRARIAREDREHKAEVIKGYLVFFVIIVALVAVGLLCGYEELFDAMAGPDTKKWAQTTLTGLLTGSLSFLVGQAIGKRAK